MQARPVEIPADDGVLLRGQAWGDGERWALLVHDEGQDLDSWRALVGWLLGLELQVLAFDLRGHGASDDRWRPAKAPADVLAALRFAESKSARWLTLVGAGAGATAALAAAGHHEVQALVGLSPRARIDGVPADLLREARAPKLFVVGSLDPAAVAEAEDILKRSIGWSVLASPPVADQGTDLLSSEWAEQIVEHMLGFLRDYL